MKRVSKKNEIRVAELFAGVGGFRIGLEGHSKKRLDGYRTVWSNQWEPATQKQHASEVYVARFGAEGHSNEDIAKVPVDSIPAHDLLVGGFPCQDYSVARTLSQAAGLQGKKGILWWEIFRILDKHKNPPRFLFLENVDRLLKSPAKARGRDFAIMLASLAKLGYAVEWRVINAADYGKPQRRKRTFILGYKKGTGIEKEMRSYIKDPNSWLLRNGVIAEGFKVENDAKNIIHYSIGNDPAKISDEFKKLFPNNIDFQNTGMMISGEVYTTRSIPVYRGKKMTLGDILEDEKKVPKEYFIAQNDLVSWQKLKGAKKEERKSKSGFTYLYSEGAMAFPDLPTNPSRTIITAEGGATPSRFKHVVKTKSGKYRRLLPIELERLCQFPENHTMLDGISDVKRAFFMGNALVVGVIEDMGRALLNRIRRSEPLD